MHDDKKSGLTPPQFRAAKTRYGRVPLNRGILWITITLAGCLALGGSLRAQTPDVPGLSGFQGFSAFEVPTKLDVKGRVLTDAASRQMLLEITVDVPVGWHLYSVSQPKGGPMPTKFRLDESGFRLAGPFQPDRRPKTMMSQAFEGVQEEYHEGKVTWRAPIELDGGTRIETLEIKGQIDGQICNENSCLPLRSLDTRFEARYDGATTTDDEFGTGGAGAIPIVPIPFDWSLLAKHIGLGILGGLILNLMPCVLPVIGLKLLSFIEQAHGSRWEAFCLNVIYAVGILSVFLVLATLAVTLNLGWGEQFTSTGFKLAMVVLVFAMALSFFGVWEIPIPGFVGRGKSQELATREGASGAFFKGVFTTILATPCSGPFLGPVFGYTVQQPPVVTYVIMLSIGFGLAFPYVVIGAFPSLIRWLPKPGAWMDTFKQLMGFTLLGGTVFLMSTLRSSLFLPTLSLLFAIWFACWIIGRIPVTLGTGQRMMRWAGAAASAAVIGLICFQLFSPGYIQWKPFSPAARRAANEQGKTVLVDFTASWCATCKYNLKFAIDTKRVDTLIKEQGIVPMLADWSDYSEEVKEALLELGAKSIPLLAIFPADAPDQPIVLPDVLTESKVLDAIRQAGQSSAAVVQRQNGSSGESLIQSRIPTIELSPTL